MTRWLTSASLLLLTLFLTLPVLALMASWARFDAAAQDVLLQMAQTVLPGYTATTLALCVAVAVGVAAALPVGHLARRAAGPQPVQHT